jgi:hypothetical protein
VLATVLIAMGTLFLEEEWEVEVEGEKGGVEEVEMEEGGMEKGGDRGEGGCRYIPNYYISISHCHLHLLSNSLLLMKWMQKFEKYFKLKLLMQVERMMITVQDSSDFYLITAMNFQT